MVELAEARVMNKKMLKKLKRHHGHRHEQEHHDGDEVLRGSLALNGNEIVVVLRGKHYHQHHHHHYHGSDPSGLETKFQDEEEKGKLYSKETKHHHRKGRKGRSNGPRSHEGTLRGLKHHVKRHQHIYQRHCRGLGLDFPYHYQPQQGQEAASYAAPVTPSAPEAELMMKSLSLVEDKEANEA